MKGGNYKEQNKYFTCDRRIVLGFVSVSRKIYVACKHGDDFSKEEKWNCKRLNY